ELGELVSRVEALFGRPQEVEWALADGQIWLLQARALVRPAPERRPADPVDWYGAWVARRLADRLSPAPTPRALATEWPSLLAERLAPLAALGQRPPRLAEV